MADYLGVKDMKNYKPLLQQLFAEALGMFLFLSIGLLVDRQRVYSVITVALSNGLLVGSIVQIIGNVSGGHINPAVTVGALVCGKIKVLRALCYIAVHLLGGIAGAAVSYALADPTINESFGAIIQHGQLSIFGLEIILTFVLVAVYLSVTDTARGARGLGSAPLAIGIIILACECSCNFYTVGMNPGRMLSTAIVASGVSKAHTSSDDWSRLWIYCLAPLVGGLAAGLVYRFALYWKVDSEESPPSRQLD